MKANPLRLRYRQSPHPELPSSLTVFDRACLVKKRTSDADIAEVIG
jgi:hypothetical protein